ncbi:MAG: hypothetical protein DME26_08040 [Verrucomicrobia bacterium]|nr:MAG: hypothetical protein DME26_08040 [Verrucomicrobiota bacterium]
MNHPTREEWMAYLYGEISRETKAALKTHLDTCAECHANVAAWRQAMLALDAWQLPAARSCRSWSPALRWAAAAAVLLFAGFGFGRAMSPTPPNAAMIRAAIEPSLKSSLETDLRQRLAREFEDKWQADLATARVKLLVEYKKQLQSELAGAADTTLAAALAEAQRLLAEFSNAETEKRVEDKQALLTVLKEMETKRLTDNAALRKDVETMAVLTELAFRSAQQEMVQLASDRIPADQ